MITTHELVRDWQDLNRLPYNIDLREGSLGRYPKLAKDLTLGQIRELVAMWGFTSVLASQEHAERFYKYIRNYVFEPFDKNKNIHLVSTPLMEPAKPKPAPVKNHVAKAPPVSVAEDAAVQYCIRAINRQLKQRGYCDIAISKISAAVRERLVAEYESEGWEVIVSDFTQLDHSIIVRPRN